MAKIRQAHVDALDAAESGDDDAETEALERAAKLEGEAEVSIDAEQAKAWKADSDKAKAEAEAAKSDEDKADEDAEPELTPTQRKLQTLKAAKAAREIVSKLKCFACRKKTGEMHMRMALGQVLCADCALEAMLDAAELADELQEKSIRDALQLTVPDLVSIKADEREAEHSASE